MATVKLRINTTSRIAENYQIVSGTGYFLLRKFIETTGEQVEISIGALSREELTHLKDFATKALRKRPNP